MRRHCRINRPPPPPATFPKRKEKKEEKLVGMRWRKGLAASWEGALQFAGRACGRRKGCSGAVRCGAVRCGHCRAGSVRCVALRCVLWLADNTEQR